MIRRRIRKHSSGAFSRDKIESYRSLCKVLLKDNKVSAERRKNAADLLGPEPEQEAFFIQAQLNEDFANLYIHQARKDKLFILYYKLGESNAAFWVAHTEKLSETKGGALEKRVIEVLNHIWAGCMMEFTAFECPNELWEASTTVVKRQHQQWQAANRCIANNDKLVLIDIALIEDSLVRDCLCSQVDKTSLSPCSELTATGSPQDRGCEVRVFPLRPTSIGCCTQSDGHYSTTWSTRKSVYQ